MYRVRMTLWTLIECLDSLKSGGRDVCVCKGGGGRGQDLPILFMKNWMPMTLDKKV